MTLSKLYSRYKPKTLGPVVLSFKEFHLEITVENGHNDLIKFRFDRHVLFVSHRSIRLASHLNYLALRTEIRSTVKFQALSQLFLSKNSMLLTATESRVSCKRSVLPYPTKCYRICVFLLKRVCNCWVISEAQRLQSDTGASFSLPTPLPSLERKIYAIRRRRYGALLCEGFV